MSSPKVKGELIFLLSARKILKSKPNSVYFFFVFLYNISMKRREIQDEIQTRDERESCFPVGAKTGEIRKKTGVCTK